MLPIVNQISPGRPITALHKEWGIKSFNQQFKCHQLCPDLKDCYIPESMPFSRAICGKVDYKIKQIMKNTPPQAGTQTSSGLRAPEESLPSSKGVFQL